MSDQSAGQEGSRQDKSSLFGNAVSILVGVALLAVLLVLRFNYGGKFDIKASDLVLLALPALLWLFASGQIASFKFGASGAITRKQVPFGTSAQISFGRWTR